MKTKKKGKEKKESIPREEGKKKKRQTTQCINTSPSKLE